MQEYFGHSICYNVEIFFFYIGIKTVCNFVDDVFAQLRLAKQQSQLVQGNKIYGHVGPLVKTV